MGFQTKLETHFSVFFACTQWGFLVLLYNLLLVGCSFGRSRYELCSIVFIQEGKNWTQQQQKINLSLKRPVTNIDKQISIN